MSIKKFLVWTVLCTLPLCAEGGRLFFKVSGGLGYLTVGTLNDYYDAAKTHYLALGENQYDEYRVDMTPIHMGLDLTGEIGLSLGKSFALAMGSGYISLSHDNSYMLSKNSPAQTFDVALNNKIKAIPLILTLYYRAALSNSISINLGVGPSYYLSTLEHNGILESSSLNADTLYKSESNILGFHGSLGLEFEVSPSVALVIECSGRFAKSDALKADHFERGVLKHSEIPLYYLKNTGIPMFGGWDPKPSSANVKDITDAILDLTGFAVRAGIRINI